MNSGKRSDSFLEKISLSFDVTSKTPPDEGYRIKDWILFLYPPNSFSAKSMALGR